MKTTIQDQTNEASRAYTEAYETWNASDERGCSGPLYKTYEARKADYVALAKKRDRSEAIRIGKANAKKQEA